MVRKGGRRLCPYDHKATFKSRRSASRLAHRLPDPENRIYWCQHAGGYHVTRYEINEYDRRQAANFRRGAGVEQLEQEKTAEITQTGRGGDCPTCGWLHGFHDPILHSYHDVPKQLTWKPGQPAPWEELLPESSRREDKRIVSTKKKDVRKVDGLLDEPPQIDLMNGSKIQDEVANTLSVLKGLTADDLF